MAGATREAKQLMTCKQWREGKGFPQQVFALLIRDNPGFPEPEGTTKVIYTCASRGNTYRQTQDIFDQDKMDAWFDGLKNRQCLDKYLAKQGIDVEAKPVQREKKSHFDTENALKFITRPCPIRPRLQVSGDPSPTITVRIEGVWGAF